MNKKLKVNSEKYKFGKFEGITLISLVITMVLHYYYCIKYSNSNGFLEAMI